MFAVDDESEPQTDSASVTLRARTAPDDKDSRRNPYPVQLVIFYSG